MLKIDKSFTKKKWFKWGVLPVVLFVFWFAATFWYIVSFDKSFLVLSYTHNKEVFTTPIKTKLLKGDKISGEFQAKENNLGILAIRFKVMNRVAYKDEDSLSFRIKEKGSKNWHYENTYRSGFIYEVPFLPFGFPLISDSKGKYYYFELESIKGNESNAVSISDRAPVLASKYQENKGELLANKMVLLAFLQKKIINAFQTVDVQFSSFVFLLPLLLYLFWSSPLHSKYIEKLQKRIDKYGFILLGERYYYVKRIGRYSFLLLVIIIVLIDILILQILNDLVYVVTFILWFTLVKWYKLDSRYTLLTSLLLFLFAPLYLLFNISSIANRSAEWAFIFLLVGVVQILSEVKRK